MPSPYTSQKRAAKEGAWLASVRWGISPIREARKYAADEVFERTVIFGLGTTGMFAGDVIRQAHPDANILFVGRSPEDSPKVVFAMDTARADYVRNAFDGPADCAKAVCSALGGRATWVEEENTLMLRIPGKK